MIAQLLHSGLIHGMRPCLLSDTPAPAYQATLHHLASTDIANLRLVSHDISSRTTQHTPYIILQLSASTTREQLQQWCRVTRQLQHVTNIHMHVTGKVAAEVFDLALKLLSLRGRVEVLHLLGCSSNSCRAPAAAAPYAAYIPTLYPIHYLGPQLKTLVVSGLAVEDLPRDLNQLAAAAAAAATQPQLQSLTLSAAWNNSGTARLTVVQTVIQQLVQTFPQLRQLNLHMPSLVPELPAAAAAAAAGTAAVAALPATEVGAAAVREQQRAAVAALAAGLAQLQHLEAVTITGMPDIWGPHPAASAAAAPTGLNTSAAPANSTGLFSCPTAAAAAPVGHALRNLDDLGCWLQQQLPQLKEVHVSTIGTNWAMSWQQQHQQQGNARRQSTAATTAACRIHSIQATCHAGLPLNRATAATPTGGSSSSSAGLVQSFSRQLCHYSSRPAADLMRHISSCQLAIQPGQTAGLASLLTRMPALRHLKVTLLTTSSQHSSATSNLAAAVVAAARVKGLQSLTLLPGMSPVDMTPDLLLPLTAAAGGPGSSLRKIRLVGTFRPQAAAAAAADSGWHVLRHLEGLQDLCIHQMGTELLQLPADCLPASLEVFEGRNLNIVAPCFSSSRNDGGSSQDIQFGNESAPIVAAAAAAAAEMRPRLRALHLQLCQLCDLGIFASNQLVELTVAGSSWPGGWPAAAAAAWPAVKHLSLWYNRDTSSNSSRRRKGACGGVTRQVTKSSASSSSSRNRDASPSAGHGTAVASAPESTAAVVSKQLVQDISHAFCQLQKLAVHGCACSL